MRLYQETSKYNKNTKISQLTFESSGKDTELIVKVIYDLTGFWWEYK